MNYSLNKTLILFLFLVCFLSASTQEKAKYGFDLRNYLETVSENERVPLLVEGDQDQLNTIIEQYGGNIRLQIDALYSIDLPAQNIPAFAEEEAVKLIEFSSTPGRALGDTMLINVRADSVMQQFQPLRTKYTGKGVLLGVIDSGIELEHPDFQDSLGNTRILYIWDQGVTFDPNRQAESYSYGIEWDSSAINAGISTHDDKANQFGHGSNVTGAAASNGLAKGNFKGVAPEVHIVSVATDFSKPNWLQTVAEAVDYIFTKADSLGMPCVINASIGTYVGSHDGLDIAARMIDKMIKEKEGRAFVCAAGNAGNQRFHLRQEPNNDTLFTWFQNSPSQHAGLGGFYFEVWSDTNDFNQVKFSIGADEKDGNTYKFRGRTAFDSINNRLNTIYKDSILSLSGNLLAYIETYAEESQERYKLEVAIVNPDSSDYLYRFESIGKGRLDIWSSQSLFRHNDMVLNGLPTISQYPAISNYQKPDSLQNIVSSFTCLPSTITVGNYYNRTTYTDVSGTFRNMNVIPGSISPNSSLGPNRKDYIKPDLCSAGDFVFAAGRLATLKSAAISSPAKVSRDSMHFRNGGTSMASPTVAGMVALYLEQCPKADYQQIKDDLLNSTYKDSYTSVIPDYTWGAGKANAFSYLKERVFTPKLSSIVLPNICEGDTLSLSGINSNLQYIWNTSADTLSEIEVFESGDYYAMALDQKGCLSPTDTMGLIFNPKPSIPDLIRRNDTLIVDVNGDLQWFDNQGAIGGARDSILKITVSGDYYCQLTDPNGCKVNSDTIKVVIVSLEENSIGYYQIYPNPNSGEVVIKFEENTTINRLELYSNQGKLVWQMEDIIGRQPLKLNWGHLPKGFYWLKGHRQSTYTIDKVIIQ